MKNTGDRPILYSQTSLSGNVEITETLRSHFSVLMFDVLDMTEGLGVIG